MFDYINIDYLEEAFPDGEVTISQYSKGQTPDSSRLEISVWNNDLRYTTNFQRQLLLEAMTNKNTQAFVIGVFKSKLA